MQCIIFSCHYILGQQGSDREQERVRSSENQFVGREDIINEIDEKLLTEQGVAVTGIGGIGYTL